MNDIERDKLMENLAENLPILRAKSNLSQAKLADMIGVSRQTLVSVEKKKRKLSWNVFLACILVFQKNAETNQLLEFYKISTNELNDYLDASVSNGGKQNEL